MHPVLFEWENGKPPDLPLVHWAVDKNRRAPSGGRTHIFIHYGYLAQEAKPIRAHNQLFYGNWHIIYHTLSSR
ncbi:MAG: hypothetical protein ACWGQW_05765, partial [bacterium]